MHKVIELFGQYTENSNSDWQKITSEQLCPFSKKKCFKVRKSSPETAIGTCNVRYGTNEESVIICPNRLLQNHKVFIDCLHLLHLHQPGNDIHIIPELSIPGGSVDFIVASVNNGKVVDFVGIEFQTLDTTGSVWQSRQEFLSSIGIKTEPYDDTKSFGINWKMTAKTILVQMHHKIATFENLNKHLVLIIQDALLDYMRKEFDFSDVHNPALPGDSLQFHAYSFMETKGCTLSLKERISTDSLGMSKCLGLNAEAKIELKTILELIERKISPENLLIV